MAGATLAPANYIVRKGDTLVGIAHKLHVSGPALRIANGLGKKNTLRVGMKLNVPGSKVAKNAKKSKNHPPVFSGDTYTVRPGDNDWTIASHTGLKIKQLHKLNPGVAWKSIRPGIKLHLPSGMSAANAPRLRSRYAVVTKNGTTVRKAQGHNAPRVATVSAGTRVTVLARDGGWYKLRFPMGAAGWVRGDLLKAAAAPVTVASRAASHKTPAKRKATAYVAVVRSRSSRAQRIAHWQNHMQNVRARYVRRWSRQQRRYVVAPVANTGDLIARAETFKGVRYSWGAASRSGTDCSGFTMQVYRGAGVKLPRTSRQQATIGNKVDRYHLDKGDLVFFHTGRGHRITHVGMYVGGGKFIHASSGGGHVQESALTGYYANRFVTARRVAKKGAAKKGAVAQKEAAPQPVEASKTVEPPVVEETTPPTP